MSWNDPPKSSPMWLPLWKSPSGSFPHSPPRAASSKPNQVVSARKTHTENQTKTTSPAIARTAQCISPVQGTTNRKLLDGAKSGLENEQNNCLQLFSHKQLPPNVVMLASTCNKAPTAPKLGQLPQAAPEPIGAETF